MIKTLKWVYKLGYNQSRNELLRLLESEREFHMSQARIKSLQEQKDDNLNTYKDRPVTPEHHEQRLKEAEFILNKLDPQKYPNIDDFLELLK
jgi:hypothetical protein